MRSSVLFSFLATAGLATAGPIPRNESSSTFTKQWALTIPRPVRFEIDTGVAKISLGVELGNAQDIPEWSSTKITSTNSSLSDIAASAISAMMGMRNSDGSFTEIGWWQAANAYTAAISYDKYSGSSTFSSQISQGMKSLIEEGPSDIFKTRGPGLRNEYNDDSLWWALACIDAAETYGDATFLSQGKALWQWIHDASLITETGIAPSMGGVDRTVVLSDQCSLEGGVYWTSLASEDYVNSITTALMMQMSARLGMGDSAQVTADWLRRHTVDGDQMVTSDGVRGDSCTTESGAFTYNTGVYIGALTKLYEDSGDMSLLQEAEEAAAAAMETTAWTDGKGMITEAMTNKSGDGVGFKSVLIRNLIKLYTVTTNDAIKDEIRGFINVNYNSLYNNARSGDLYDTNWNGPFSGQNTNGQFIAIDLLVAGMVVNA